MEQEIELLLELKNKERNRKEFHEKVFFLLKYVVKEVLFIKNHNFLKVIKS